MKNLGTQYLETERLILRKITLDDASDMFHNWANSSNVTKFLTWDAHQSLEETKNIIKTWVESYEKSSTYHWVIFNKDDSKCIGTIGINGKIRSYYQIGYCLGEEYWNKGFMTEALKEILRFLFVEVKMREVRALFDENNIASGKVMEKCGLKFSSIIKNYLIKGEEKTIIEMKITKREYKKIYL